MCVSIFGGRRCSNVLAEGHSRLMGCHSRLMGCHSRLMGCYSRLMGCHSRLMGCQFLPMFSSLPGFRIGMIIALCHISGICPVVIEDVGEIVFGIMSEFMRWRVLIPSCPMAVDDLENRIDYFVSAGVKDGFPVYSS